MRRMQTWTLLFAGAATLAVGLAPVSACAGDVMKFVCQGVGPSPTPEKVGDSEGHAITVGAVSCRVEGGLLEGAVSTGSNIFEWDKTTAALVSASGVMRRPGTLAVYQYTEGKIEITMTDGKPTGFTGSGRGRWAAAGGGAAALAGKTFTWASKSTGPGQFETIATPD